MQNWSLTFTMQVLRNSITNWAIEHPKRIVWALIVSTLLLIAIAALPSLWPQQFSSLHPISVDTDPENMLSEDEPVRLFNDQAKKEFGLSDIVVVGIVNDEHPQGVFNPESLKRIHVLTEFARQLQWPTSDNPDVKEGVIEVDMIAPSMVDNLEQGGLGVVKFSWLMPEPPTTDAEALLIRDRAQHIPLLNNTLVSGDGKAMALYLPLTDKHVSYEVRDALLEQTKSWAGTGDVVHITGLPVAEDTFGVEMFIQMAISAPMAMLVIFLLLWFFFKKLILIASPMIVAMVCAMTTMALLIISGNTIHIMSSMIPIFIMPIAVLDSVHILSEFFDRYPIYKDKRKTLEDVLGTLFMPMLFTTLTTIAGFGSLALTPIPPVQVFGIFIAVGVFLAWFWTILFIPAFIMLIPEHKLEGFGHVHSEGQEDRSLMGRMLQVMGKITSKRPGIIMALTMMLVFIAGYGISQIQINDNPTKWFNSSHPIRVADKVMNEHFGGTYMAYLQISSAKTNEKIEIAPLLERLKSRKQQLVDSGLANVNPIFNQVSEQIQALSDEIDPIATLNQWAEAESSSSDDNSFMTWDEVLLFLDEERQRKEIFKQPDVLRWVSSLQEHMTASDIVGKANSLPDIVKTVHRELLLGEQKEFRIPDTAKAVGQTLITFQNSHRPHDLWHFVTPDYRKANLWLQLSSGDNRDMEKVISHLNEFISTNPAPLELNTEWFGLTYINVVWQEKMVNGMLEAFLGSFVIVLLMMVFLFRSLLWGLLSMIPLTVTVGLIYGIIGLIGKDYDMPVAVLSALSLGLAIDYAIHFLARARVAEENSGNWRLAVKEMFGEPARAITRNAIILGAGFAPLLAAPLIPYKTVGVFIAAIILCAGLASLLILPSLITLFERKLFPNR